MGQYEDTLKDIEKTFGVVPGFMKAIPKDIHQYFPLSFKTRKAIRTRNTKSRQLRKPATAPYQKISEAVK